MDSNRGESLQLDVLRIFNLRFPWQTNFQLGRFPFALVNKLCHHQITSKTYSNELEACMSFVKWWQIFSPQATALTSLEILKRGKRAMLIKKKWVLTHKYHHSNYLKLMSLFWVLNESKTLEWSNTEYDIRLLLVTHLEFLHFSHYITIKLPIHYISLDYHGPPF